MAQLTLEERINALEETVAGLVAASGTRKQDWRSSIGMFEGDPIIQEIQTEGRKLREAERRAAQQDRNS